MPPVEQNGQTGDGGRRGGSADLHDGLPASSAIPRPSRVRYTIPSSVLPWWAIPGEGRKYPYNPFYGEFSPRVAVAWSPHFDSDSLGGKIFGHENTVIRGGYGRSYGRTNGVAQVLVPLLGLGLEQPVACTRTSLPAGAGPVPLRVQALGRTASVLGKTPLLAAARPSRCLRWQVRRCPNRSILGSITLPPPRQKPWIPISGPTRLTRSTSPSSVS